MGVVDFACGGSAPPGAVWACAENAKTVNAAASGRTILDRLEAFILENPSFAVPKAVWTAEPGTSVLLTDFVAACLLQISKIATILRQARISAKWQQSRTRR